MSCDLIACLYVGCHADATTKSIAVSNLIVTHKCFATIPLETNCFDALGHSSNYVVSTFTIVSIVLWTLSKFIALFISVRDPKRNKHIDLFACQSSVGISFDRCVNIVPFR